MTNDAVKRAPVKAKKFVVDGSKGLRNEKRQWKKT